MSEPVDIYQTNSEGNCEERMDSKRQAEMHKDAANELFKGGCLHGAIGGHVRVALT